MYLSANELKVAKNKPSNKWKNEWVKNDLMEEITGL